MIRIGPAGWSYKDWEGIVYPKPKPKGFEPISFLAKYFDTLEINSSFYGPPRPSAAKNWAAHVSGNPQFLFTAKLYQAFTHKRDATEKDERDFKEGILPLIEAERFGALLLQFPWSFKYDRDNRQYLVKLHKRFREFPLVLEVRHSTWASPDVLNLLAELDIGLANIDQPLFRDSVKPGVDVTSSIGYVRLHGRNYKSWFSPTADVRERYDYLYSPEELEPWVDRIKTIARNTKRTYAVTNNHHVGKAITNALEISSILNGEPVPAPALLVEHYPGLKPFTISG